MSLLGKEVQFTAQFLRDTGQHVGDWPLKRGTVVKELPLSEGKSLVTVDDAAFGEWKAHSANIELVQNNRDFLSPTLSKTSGCLVMLFDQ